MGKGKRKKKELWIGDALKKHKKGATHRHLGIPLATKIPITLLRKIKNANIGETVKNPTKTGKPKYKVTRLLKQRCVLAHTLRGF